MTLKGAVLKPPSCCWGIRRCQQGRPRLHDSVWGAFITPAPITTAGRSSVLMMSLSPPKLSTPCNFPPSPSHQLKLLSCRLSCIVAQISGITSNPQTVPSPGGKASFHAAVGTLSVLEAIGNNHRNKQGVAYDSREGDPRSPEKTTLQSP